MPNGSGQGDPHAIASVAEDLARRAAQTYHDLERRVYALEERVKTLEREIKDLHQTL